MYGPAHKKSFKTASAISFVSRKKRILKKSAIVLVDHFIFAVLSKTTTTAAWKLHLKYGT